MKKSMCITYVVDGSLYVNVTNRCSNSCDFCIRNNGDGAYGSDSLWLEREPTVSEILDAIFLNDLTAYPELVFCGYGEPSYRLEEIREIAISVKEKCPGIRIRINTNGQSDLILGRSTAHLYADVFDAVSISLNSPTACGYNAVCHSLYGENAFYAILDFAKSVKSYVPNTRFSVVDEFLTKEEIEACKRIANELGVPLRIREYISS